MNILVTSVSQVIQLIVVSPFRYLVSCTLKKIMTALGLHCTNHMDCSLWYGLSSCGTQASLVAMRGLSCSTWDLSSLTRDGIRAPCIGSMESYLLDHQGCPHALLQDIKSYVFPTLMALCLYSQHNYNSAWTKHSFFFYSSYHFHI